MRCDELKDYDYDPDFPFQSRGRFYVADDVESAIAELKDENHMLKRALWLARAMCAQESQYWGAYVRYVHLHENSFYEFINDDIFHRDNPNNDSFRMWSNRWRSVERKCRAKAEEYK